MATVSILYNSNDLGPELCVRAGVNSLLRCLPGIHFCCGLNFSGAVRFDVKFNSEELWILQWLLDTRYHTPVTPARGRRTSRHASLALSVEQRAPDKQLYDRSTALAAPRSRPAPAPPVSFRHGRVWAQVGVEEQSITVWAGAVSVQEIVSRKNMITHSDCPVMFKTWRSWNASSWKKASTSSLEQPRVLLGGNIRHGGPRPRRQDMQDPDQGRLLRHRENYREGQLRRGEAGQAPYHKDGGECYQ